MLFIISSLTTFFSIAKETMNNHMKQKQGGQFLAKDKLGTPVVVQWTKTTIMSPDFANAMKEMWPLARGAYTPVEMDFLKAFPEVVGTEPYFKPFEPLFQNGVANVDWLAAQTAMESILEGHFVFDPTQLSEQVVAMFANDSCFLVTVNDQETGTPLGFITFLARANYTAGEVKVMSFAVQTTHQKRGLGKLLMSSIFKIAPKTKRIFLATRVTNNVALHAYSSWGFVTDKKPILDHAFNLKHWSFMDYKAEQCDVLQNIAQELYLVS